MASNKELVSPVLRKNFQEFCVTYLVLRQINDVFTMAGVERQELDSTILVSGQRRTLVEEYYAGIVWCSVEDVEKFLSVLGYTLAQTYLDHDAKDYLREIISSEGLQIDGIHVSRWYSGSKVQESGSQDKTADDELLSELKQRLLSISKEKPQKRGFAFERFLVELFEAFGLDPRGSFRLIGEQIDGSFECNSATYLLEAKWHSIPTPQRDLLILREKVENKSSWARGLFVSMNGFTPEGLEAFSRGRATNILGMSGQDIYFILDGQISLSSAISMKARRAAETGEFFVPVFNLIRE